MADFCICICICLYAFYFGRAEKKEEKMGRLNLGQWLNWLGKWNDAIVTWHGTGTFFQKVQRLQTNSIQRNDASKRFYLWTFREVQYDIIIVEEQQLLKINTPIHFLGSLNWPKERLKKIIMRNPYLWLSSSSPLYYIFLEFMSLSSWLKNILKCINILFS